jgi:hypothetical protein
MLEDILNGLKFVIDIVIDTLKTIIELPSTIFNFFKDLLSFFPYPFDSFFSFLILFILAIFVYKLVR